MAKSSNPVSFGSSSSTPGHQANPGCIWLNSESVKNRVDTKALMAKQALPANSISVQGNSLLVAGDTEAIYVIPEIAL